MSSDFERSSQIEDCVATALGATAFAVAYACIFTLMLI
jgi:hypothetical protein